MTQSLGISVLLRAYQFTGNSAYFDAAKAALEWIRKPLSDGGTAYQGPEGIWYEEYPNPERPSHVLNGHMWALFGIWDYFRVTNDPDAARMFREGVEALKAEIHRYDVGYWVVYDQLNQVDMINGFYLGFVVEQLKAMHAISGVSEFQAIARKWDAYRSTDSLFGHMAFQEFEKAVSGKR